MDVGGKHNQPSCKPVQKVKLEARHVLAADLIRSSLKTHLFVSIS